MLQGYYSGLSGIYYNQQKLAVVSNNVANSDTTGFRRSYMVFKTRDENPQEARRVHSDVRSRLPKFHGMQRTGIYKDYQTVGRMQETSNPFDVAIAPELNNAFFAVKKDPKNNEVFYTRNGTLSIGPLNPENPDSPNVLKIGGFNAIDEMGQPISIDPSNGTLAISPEGLVSQGEENINEIPIYRLNKSDNPLVQQGANLQALEQLGNSLYKVPKGQEKEFNPIRLEVGVGGIRRLLSQGVRESSNVNTVKELVEMMGVTKAAEANSNSLKTQAGTLSKLFQMVRQG